MRDVEDELDDVPHLAETEVYVSHMVEIEVSNTLEMAKVPHPFEADATTTIEVTPKIIPEAHTPHTAIEVSPTDDMEVTHPVETNDTAPSSIDPFVHTDGGFL
ncbi:unnamed protein product [Vicia faba]|uniref:Uncharacterized protein n=1 Tax=Vicia faba TaxID=3906 RepID=A0AAV0ZY13_VICFA|nr:unnamed protein product [Vicia faba]